MRHFIYFSQKAQTSGNFNDLMKAGRLDIAIHVIIASFFLSHGVRDDVKTHLVFYGMPDPPKHIEMQVTPELDISKKDVATLIKKILYKYKPGQKTEVLPGCFVEKKNLFDLIEELIEQGNELFILDKRGEKLRDAEIPEDCIFLLGDQDGIPKKELRRLKDVANKISIGPKMYFASHVVAVVNNELDNRGQ